MADDHDDLLISAAVLLDTPEKFRSVRDGVLLAAAQATPGTLRRLTHRFHAPPDTPANFRPQIAQPSRSFAWSLIWLETVCEVFHQGREAGLPALREAAFGGEEGQDAALAFSLLCRLAAEGVGREQFLGDVHREFPKMTSQAQVFAVDTLRSQGIRPTDSIWRQARPDPDFAASLEPLKEVPCYRQAEQRLRDLYGEQQ